MLAELEKNYFEAVTDASTHWQKVCRSLIRAIRKNGGKAHVNVKLQHKHESDPWDKNPYDWWLYDVDDIGIGFTWVKTPEHPINPGLGQAYYTESRIAETKDSQTNLTWLAFEAELYKWLDANPPLQNGEVLKLKINNRFYWFGGLYDKYMQLYWKLLHKPNGVITEKEV